MSNISSLEDIYNRKKFATQKFYDSFNDFIFSSDRRVFGKLIHRYDFFLKTKHLPGDIVEVGVFKGSGIATWSKFIDLFATHTTKTVIGFDLFNIPETKQVLDTYKNGEIMKTVINRTETNMLTVDSVEEQLRNANIDSSRYLLIPGDVSKTSLDFVKNNPGFRISVLYLDVDLEEPTYGALCALWDRVVPGGYIIFDEYEYHKFDESNGVDKFLKEKGIKYKIITTNFYAPSAYIIKE